MHSEPTYSHKHHGTLLVIGSAPCVREDLVDAVMHRPGAAIMAVNEAVKVARPNFITSLHCEKMDVFDALAQQQWGGKIWSTHSGNVTARGQERHHFATVDYWWPTMKHCGGTSAWAAAMIGAAMGFEEIILCGCPMNGGDGYFNDGETAKGTPSDPRFGYKPAHCSLIQSAHDHIQKHKDTPEAALVSSMSGFTSEILGTPSWQQ